MAYINGTLANNATGTLQAGIAAGTTAIVLGAGQGGLFPSTFPFWAKIEQYDTAVNNYRVLKREIIRVTNRVGDTLTAVRAAGSCPTAYNSTTQTATALSFNAGDTIVHTWTAEQAKDVQDTLATAVQQASAQTQSHTFATATGSSNAYAVTLTPAPAAYAAGLRVQFIANFANTGSATLNVNGLGAKTIQKLGGTANLGSGDIGNGMIVDVVYDGTNFEMQTPIAQSPTVDINGQTEDTSAADADSFLQYNVSATSNRKITFANLRRSAGKFGGTGADGAIANNASITITGSNNTVFVKNYTSWAAGDQLSKAFTNDPAAGSSIVLNMANTGNFAVNDIVRVSSSAGSEFATVTAIATNVSITVDTLALNHTTTSPLVTKMRVLTITPTNCLLHIKIQGDCNLSGWYLNFQGKGGQSGIDSYGYPLALVYRGGNGGGALNSVTGGTAGTSTAKLHPNTPESFINNKLLAVSSGSCGGTGGGGLNGGTGAPGTGGGAVIFEVFGNLTVDATTTCINLKGNNGVIATAGGAGGGG